MTLWMALALSAVAAYLLGSVNSAILVSRLLAKDDIRAHGSGNAGMTNMLRTFGRKAALLTTLGDLLKAMASVLLARGLVAATGTAAGFDPGYAAGFFVLLGHIFPVFFGFRGGKGVMPALGVVLLVDPVAFLVLLAVAVPVFLAVRIMSVVSLASAALLPPVTLVLCLLRQADPLVPTLATALYAALVAVSHRENIRRLRAGTEKRIVPKQRD